MTPDPGLSILAPPDGKRNPPEEAPSPVSASPSDAVKRRAPSPRSFQYVILGGGPTGLGAAYRLMELGIEDFVVLEKEDIPGGLAASFTDPEGFTWDVGGHVQFSHYKYFDDLMDRALGKDGWWSHQRESWVWMEERFVPYPLQNNLRYLSKETLWKCLQGLMERAPLGQGDKPRHFEEWILAAFGKGLAEAFLFPYNFKVWAYPPRTLSAHWVGERVALADLKRVTQNILFEKDDLSWGPNSTFRFPRKGGTGAVWRAVAEMVGTDKIHYGAAVQRVQAASKVVTTRSGEKYGYQYLINTLPLDLFTQMIEDGPLGAAGKAAGLRCSATHIFGVGLRGLPPAHLGKKCWMYFPEDNCPFYRVTVFSNYSPHNVPDPRRYWSLMAEVSESPEKPVNRGSLMESVIQGMLNTRLIASRADVASIWSYRAGHGYPTPSLERDSILGQVLPELERHDIFSRGRFGAWKYEVSNQDHSLMQGVEVVNRLALGIPETTLPFPDTANANWGRVHEIH